MKINIFKIITLLFSLIIIIYLLLIYNENVRIKAKIKVENFCNSVQVGFGLPEHKKIEEKKIVYNDEKFFEYDEVTLSGTWICMVEMKDGKVINKNFKYLH